jgi:hypothetical protein
MMVGAIGAGKTSLLRVVIGSHPERDRFPSTSASRTTISDTEVITSDEPVYRAVVTFFNEWAVHTYVHECVADACAALWDECSDERLAERLLTHRDLRFRLGYVIGSWKQVVPRVAPGEDEWAYGDAGKDEQESVDEADGALPISADVERMHATLASFLSRIRGLADEGKERLQAERNLNLETLSESEKEAAQDLFEDMVQSLPDFDELVNDIMDEIKKRF